MPKPENVVGKGFEKHPERINKKGRPPVLPDLRIAIAKCLAEEKDGRTALDTILSAMRLKAVKGDVRAAQELLDRGFGKAKQTIEHTGTEPLTIRVINGTENK